MIKTEAIKTDVFFKNSLKKLNIDKSRQELLSEIATFLSNELKTGVKVNLNFMCMDNSRKSQLLQVWASYATHFFKLKNIESFSGGNTVTAFYINTFKTLQEVGFNFQILEFSHQNPEYLISYENCLKPIIGFSKLYDDVRNKKPYIVITTSSIVNENCHFIPDTIQCFHLPFADPNIFDGTTNQAEKYRETSKQIAGEIHFIFKLINKSI